MELDLGSSIILDELDEELLLGLLESAADSTGVHNYAADAHLALDVFENGLKNKVNDGHDKPVDHIDEKAHTIHTSSSSSSSSSSPFSSSLSAPHETNETNEKREGDSDFIDLAAVFQDYEVEGLENSQHDGGAQAWSQM